MLVQIIVYYFSMKNFHHFLAKKIRGKFESLFIFFKDETFSTKLDCKRLGIQNILLLFFDINQQ